VISVLCPSRGRERELQAALTSLNATAASARDLELLIRLDNDDPELRWYTRVVFENQHLTIGPREGYANLHRYYNELAADAHGDYLLLWNDDARMLTPGWDSIVRDALDPTIPAVGSFDGPDYALFPIVTRAFYEALGHFSLSPHCDGWVQEVAKAAGCFTHLPGVTVEHLRDELDDETKREGTTAQQTLTSAAFYSDEMVALRSADAEKVKAALVTA
jgi:hypothetical protein